MKKIPKAKKVGRKTKTTRVRKTTAAKKQSSLDKLNFADGKQGVEKVRELEELLGIDQMNIFRTNDIEVFKENLAEMTTTDMQTLAAEAGIFPGGNKMALKNRLTKEFVSQTKGNRHVAGPARPIVSPDDPRFEKLQKLMSEGL
jgi:hypothetical protein